jgi:hypothetical protein
MQKVHAAFLGLGSQGEQLFQATLSATKTALATGITYAFLVGAIITVGALVVGIFLQEVPLRKTHVMAEGVLALDGSDDQAVREAAAPAMTSALAPDPPLLDDRDGPAAAAAAEPPG